eukprot:6025386-Amphidinium_carterae.1
MAEHLGNCYCAHVDMNDGQAPERHSHQTYEKTGSKINDSLCQATPITSDTLLLLLGTRSMS